MQLNAVNVYRMFENCNPHTGDDASRFRVVAAITRTACLNPEKLERYRDDIIDMLHQLPDKFQKTNTGESFLKAMLTKDGVHWTRSHLDIEALFMLGLGIGAVECPVPKKLWHGLPGGLPYYRVTV